MIAREGERALWVSRTGERLSARSADRDVRVVAAAAGLQLSAHTLRHTCLTGLVRRGNDLVMVAELAGHTKLETTRRYTLPSAADRQRAVEDLRSTTDRGEALGHPNETERRRLERFPDRIAVEDLRACFALQDRDRDVGVRSARAGEPARAGRVVVRAAVPGVRARRRRVDPGRGAGVSRRPGRCRPARAPGLRCAAADPQRPRRLVLAHLGWRRDDERL